MFDFLQDRGSTAEDKRRETLSAYLDNALTAAEREHFDSQLVGDANLRTELEQMRILKFQMRGMPRRRVPRSFALDPALYSRPKAQPWMQLYPVLRGATALTAFFLIFTLALGAFRGQFVGGGDASPAATEITMLEEVPVEESAAFGEAAPLAAPAAGAAEDRIIPTTAVEAEAAEAPAAEAAPGELTVDSTDLPPAESTPFPEAYPALTDVPAAELAVEATAMAEPTLGAAVVDLAQSAEMTEAQESTTTMVSPEESTANSTIEESVTEDSGESILNSLLRPVQIGLAAAFILFFVLWLIARRRSRSF